MHFDDGDYNPAVKKCFAKLELESNNSGLFSLTANPRKNLAGAVVAKLGWKIYQDYERDMLILCR
jgi:hypothetical protein